MPAWGSRPASGVGEQYRTVRSAVDIDGIAQRTADGSTVRHELGLDPSAFVVGSITRLASQKDPDTLVSGFAAFAATAPDAVLVVVGDGPLAETIVVRVAELGLQDRVHLLGARGDAAGLLGAFDVFVSPARWEGLPRTVLEAAVAGVPIVTTPVGGVPEVVEHDRSGLLVEVGDSAGLGEALGVLHADPALHAHLANGARRRVGAEFDVTTMAERLVEVWGEVAGRPAELAGQHRAPCENHFYGHARALADVAYGPDTPHDHPRPRAARLVVRARARGQGPARGPAAPPRLERTDHASKPRGGQGPQGDPHRGPVRPPRRPRPRHRPGDAEAVRNRGVPVPRHREVGGHRRQPDRFADEDRGPRAGAPGHASSSTGPTTSRQRSAPTRSEGSRCSATGTVATSRSWAASWRCWRLGDRIATNRVGSALWYGARLGLEAEIYGPCFGDREAAAIDDRLDLLQHQLYAPSYPSRCGGRAGGGRVG